MKQIMNKPIKNSFAALLVSSLMGLFLMSCSTTPKSNQPSYMSIEEGQYENVLQRYTKSEKRYSGFYNQFDVSVTELNQISQFAILQRKAGYLQWDEKTFAKEKERVTQEMSSSTYYFVSFYTPDRDINDLVNADSVWKFYLEVNGKRYTAHIRQSSENRAELKNLFVNFGRFHKPYTLRFDIPTSEIENTPHKLILTSSLGTADFSY